MIQLKGPREDSGDWEGIQGKGKGELRTKSVSSVLSAEFTIIISSSLGKNSTLHKQGLLSHPCHLS